MKIRIVSDSASNIFEMEDIEYGYASLKIVIGDQTFIDEEEMDRMEMLEQMKAYQGTSRTSCPNVADWMEAFGDADVIYCVTMTSNLSGTYNAAVLAKEHYLEEHPDAKIYLLDSLSIGPEVQLIMERIREDILCGESFEQTVKDADAYSKRTHLLFSLESMDNLAKNGRVSPLVAKAAGILGVRVIGKASEEGTLQPLHKCRGEKKTLLKYYEEMKNHGYEGGKVRISHVFNEELAEGLEKLIRQDYPDAEVEKLLCGGLCSFYAEKGGMIVGYEGKE